MCILKALTGGSLHGIALDAAGRYQHLKKGHLSLRVGVMKDDGRWRQIAMMRANDLSQRLRMPSALFIFHVLTTPI